MALILLAAPGVAADPVEQPEQPTIETPQPMPTPHLRLSTGEGTLIGPNGKLFTLPQGSHIITGDVWHDLDSEMLRLQESETRLSAENKRLRQSVESWSPGWKSLAVAVGSGLALGWYLNSRLTD
jgi:hypothetical protein